MEKDIFRLLVKKISGELDKAEEEKLNGILAQDKEVAREYELLKRIWHNLPYPYKNEEISKSALRKIKDNIKQTQSKQYYFNPQIISYFITVSLMIFIIVFALVYKKNIIITNNDKVPKTVVLPDKSTVILDRQASISYKLNIFNQFDRRISLNGRAFFKITKQRDKTPFIIDCKKLNIKVLGTQFNVNNTQYKIDVALKEGKVKLYNFNQIPDTCIIMQPDEIVEYQVKTGKIVHKRGNIKVQTYWMNDRIIFENFTISDLAEIFKTYYGKILIFEDTTIKYKRIGGSAPTDDLSLIIKALELITDREIIQSNDTLYFK